MANNARARWAFGCMALALAAGCGFNLGDVDRTQPDKVKKSIFTDGKPWYFRQTIIDLPSTSEVSFIGEQGGTYKVLWFIDENFLFALRAHEQLKGAEEYAARPGVPYRGTPVAAFAISDHFDIQREYNAATGEQTNVISENTTDRPWYERDYMRVDWSENLITDFTFSGSSVMQQAVARYVREGENDKDAAQIGENYLDVVHEMVVEAEVNDYLSEYYGFPIPNCWLYSSIYVDCLGSRMKVRSSFVKATEEYAYEPMQFDDVKFAKFGYFRTDRFGYDRYYGVIEDKIDYLIERFNIWKQRAGEAPCVSPMSAHPYENCSNERLKPIVYYQNEDTPEYIKGANLKVGAEWNRVFKAAVSQMTGRAETELPDIFVMCPNNPVQAGDPAVCGAPNLNPQIGDIRYNMVYYVRGRQQSSPLGYGPHAADPLTGEVLSANSFIYGAALETYAQYTLDFIKLQNGDLSVNDLFNGENITEHYARVRSRRREYTDRSRMTAEQWRKAAGSMHIKQKAQVLRDRVRRGELKNDEVQARVNMVRDTPVEGMLMNEDIRKALLPQFDRADDVPPALRRFMSPATLADPTFWQTVRQRETRLGMATVDMPDFFEDDGTAGLARRLSCDSAKATADDIARFCDTNGKLKEMEAYNFLLDEIYVGVTLHEVGHNVGLRHNFAGSSDALNYFPKYWELKSLTLRTGTQQDLKPEFELTTPAERTGIEAAINQGVREYQYSSIMDYGSKPNSDVHGLGLYDYAAILYGYGQMVEVFDRGDASSPPKVTREGATLLTPVARHYSQIPGIVSNDASYNYFDRTAALYKRRAVPERVVEANIDLVEVPYRFCSDEYVDGLYYCYRFDQGADAYEQVMNNVSMYENYYVFNSLRRNRVGFAMNLGSYLGRIYGRYFSFLSAQNKHFLNDNLINRFYDPGCQEGIHFVDSKCGLDRFVAAIEAGNALGRAIQTPEPGCYVRRKPGCYVDSFEDVNGLPADIQAADPTVCQNGTAPSGYSTTLVGAADPYTHIEDSLDCAAWRPLVTAGADSVWEPALEIALGDGRYALDKYSREQYGYGFYWKPVAIGSWWDKWLAMQALGDPYTDFLGVDSRGDARSFLISFNNLYRNDIASAVSSFITEDSTRYGPYITLVNGNVKLGYRDMLQKAQSALSGSLGGAPGLPPGAISLDPDDQYTTRLQALFIGTAYYSQITDDQDFNQTMFIGKAGSTVDITVPDSIRNPPMGTASRYAEITDPVTGYIYYAVKMNPDQAWFLTEAPFYSAGYEFLKRVRDEYMMPDGRTMKPGASLSGLRGEIRMFEIIRAFLRVYGYNDAWGFSW